MSLHSLCRVCEAVVLTTSQSEYVEYLGQRVCPRCVSALSSSACKRSLPKSTESSKFDLRDPAHPIVCWNHNREGVSHCRTCETVLCLDCVIDHKSHTRKPILKEVRSIEDGFEQVDSLAIGSESAGISDVKAVRNLRKEIRAVFEQGREGYGKDALTWLRKELRRLYSSLMTLNPTLWGLTPRSNFHIMQRLPYTVPLRESHLHWAEWNGCSLHLLNIQSLTILSYKVPEGFLIPLYSRSLFLPNSSLILIGGRHTPSSNGLRKVWYLTVSPWSVSPGPDSLFGHANHSLQLFETLLFVLGGCNEANNYTNKCEVLDLSSGQWSELPSMSQIRDSVASVLDKKRRRIFVFAGRVDQNRCLDTVEYLDLEERRWVSVALTLPYPIYMHGAVYLPDTNRVVIYGGLYENHSKCNRSFLIDLRTLTTETLPSMPSAGCIIDPVTLIGKSIIALIFYGYASRQINRLELDTMEWTKI